jgi:beta-aspartyl-peptidase (threonine type)
MKAAAARGEPLFDKALKYGTVGAVARDANGRLAAATSTGGLTGKRWGRIGDSPLIGAGTWADDRAVAISATGSGEDFIRVAAAHEIGARIRMPGETPRAAADAVIAELKALGGDGGVIFAGADGSCGWSFNTPGMFRACVTASQKPVVAIFDDEG